jgi:hypothetical protein
MEPPPALNVTVFPEPAEYFGHVPLIAGSFVGIVAPVSFTLPLLEPPLELLVVVPPLLLLSPELLPVPPELLVVPLDPPPRLELPELLVDPWLDPLELDPLEPDPLELVPPPEELRPFSEPLLLPDGAPLSLPLEGGFAIPELLSSPLAPGSPPTPPVAQA